MMAYWVIGILVVALVLFITEWLPLPVTSMSVAVAFYLVGAVDAKTTLAAFSNATATIIVCMAIIGEAVFKTGGAAMIGNVLNSASRGSERKLVFCTVVLSGIMSGFLSNTGAAALLIALILGVCSSTGMKRSKLMYPVIVGCCFGGGITIIGNTSSPYLKETLEGLGTGQTLEFFEWAPLCLILILISAIYLSTVGFGLMPDRPNNEDTFDASKVKVVDYGNVPAWKKWTGLGIMFATLLGMIFEKKIGIPLHFVAIIGALITVGARLITVNEASRAIPVSGLVIYAALVPVAKAMTNSGVADMIAKGTLSVLSQVNSPLMVLCLIFLIITPLTNFMSNAAAIFLFTPIALIVAQALNMNPKAMITVVRFAASIAVATPVAMPANSMAVEPGGYSFNDYVRPGLLLTAVCVIVTIAYVSYFYPLAG